MARIHRTIPENLNDLDNHKGLNTYPEPDIPECEVKWAFGSIKLVEVMEFQLSYFKS